MDGDRTSLTIRISKPMVSIRIRFFLHWKTYDNSTQNDGGWGEGKRTEARIGLKFM